MSTFDFMPFTISEFIEGLEEVREEHGDIQIAARSIDDDTGLVQHDEGVGIWVFLKAEATLKDQLNTSLDKKFLSIG